jgi:hypothetical protein
MHKATVHTVNQLILKVEITRMKKLLRNQI